MKVYLHLAEGFEEIEALGVVDVLRRANIVIETVSITGKKEVTGSHDIIIIADRLFEEADYDQVDMIVFPGGMPGAENLEKHEGLMEKIKEFNHQDKWIAAICAAPKILGKLGILKNKIATCYPGYEIELKGAQISYNPVVQSGKIITSRGPGTTILFALKIVEVLNGSDIADKLKAKMVVSY